MILHQECVTLFILDGLSDQRLFFTIVRDTVPWVPAHATNEWGCLLRQWDKTHLPHICFAGEVGLAGEIRPVSKIDQRITEARKLGYRTIVISKYNQVTVQEEEIQLILVGKINEVFAALFA